MLTLVQSVATVLLASLAAQDPVTYTHMTLPTNRIV